jgi:hypothetical protein
MRRAFRFIALCVSGVGVIIPILESLYLAKITTCVRTFSAYGLVGLQRMLTHTTREPESFDIGTLLPCLSLSS